MRNTVILSSIALMIIVGGIVFFLGKSGSISADVDSEDCKYYTFTDRKSYKPNQTINFGVKNDKYSKCTLQIRNDIGPWNVLDAKNKIVYKASSVGDSQKLKPGERKDWQWNMTNNQGSTVPAGQYKIKFTSLNKEAAFTVSSY